MRRRSVGSASYELGVDAVVRGEHAEPVVALLLARTEEEVARAELRIEDTEVGLMDGGPLVHRVVGEHVQVLQGEGIVEVHNQDLAQLPEKREEVEDEALDDQHLMPCRELAEPTPDFERIVDGEVARSAAGPRSAPRASRGSGRARWPSPRRGYRGPPCGHSPCHC